MSAYDFDDGYQCGSEDGKQSIYEIHRAGNCEHSNDCNVNQCIKKAYEEDMSCATNYQDCPLHKEKE